MESPGPEQVHLVREHEVPRRDLRRTRLDPNFWYPVARSRALPRGKAIGTTFAGEPIVLVRTKSAAIFALEDRCAHRQVPLHLGVVKGEHLQCGYHCWTYDCAGHCINIPYLDEAHELPNGVRSYPCREAYGLIFVFAGTPARAATVPFPDLANYANPRYRTHYLDRKVRCHYSFMHENLMDMNHQFLHRRLMGRIRALLLERRKGPGWVEADYTFRRASRQPWGERFILGGGLRQPREPSDDLMTIRTEYPYQRLRFWTAGSQEPALDLWNAYIPLDRQQHWNHTYGLMMIRKPGIPGLAYLLWPFIVWFSESIFAQDRRIVEEEQKAFDRQGADWNQEIFPVIQDLRQLLLDCGVPPA